jgi:uncharacterized membrane protein
VTAWRFTAHARHRIEEMGLTKRDVLGVLLAPEVSYEQTNRDGRVWQRGRIAVVTALLEPVVITVLWNIKDRWER